jgi:hypothetical protein
MINKNKLPGALLLLVITSFSPLYSTSQIRWDGGGGDSAWTTAANWAGDILPAATDNVLLDNSLAPGNYTVILPAGSAVVTVRSLTIQPATHYNIEVLLPVASTATPAFIATGPGYGLQVTAGGIFRNASGITSGMALQVADSVKIFNGGKYIHQCLGAHSSLVQVLSTAAGTEEGIFEFDIPDASTTVSLSNRTYGKLVFSAVANGGGAGYTAAGTNPIIIRSDLEIGAGVALTLNFSDTLFINRHFIQHGGTFNVGSAVRSLVTTIRGNIQQNAGVVRETGNGALPEIKAAGITPQLMKFGGSITDSITVTIDNAAGVTLQSAVSLPFKLRLINGRVTSSALCLLTLLPGCVLEADSVLNNSFINGPLRKEGLQATNHFLFPVGKDQVQRWVALKNATGHFTVEFIKSNPSLLNGACGPGIHHISTVEHWSLRADAVPLPSANVEISFNDANSGGVTDLSTLRIAQLAGGTWTNAGNTAVTGAAGGSGSVVSNAITLFDPLGYFTLAGSTGTSNPLPLPPLAGNDRRPSHTPVRGIVLKSITALPHTVPVVTIAAAEKTVVQLLLTGMEGRTFTTAKLSLQRGINNIPVMVPAWARGLYTIRAVHSKGQSNVLRFMK